MITPRETTCLAAALCFSSAAWTVSAGSLGLLPAFICALHHCDEYCKWCMARTRAAGKWPSSYLADARSKVASAHQANAPLAIPSFGSTSISVPTRVQLATSLVFSKSLFGVAAWRGTDERAIQLVSARNCTAFRRIAGQMRYGRDGTATEEQV